MVDLTTGKVWFVGAGPGASDLLTLRAVKLLEQADVVLYDALGTEHALAYCQQARLVAVGKRAGTISTEQTFINRRLVTEASAGNRVVRLKGGDPTIFGRLDEETTALRNAGIAFDVTPGITAASAAAAAAGVSLTKRGIARSVVITTPAVQRGGQSDTQWLRSCEPNATTAIYMAGRKTQSTAQALIDRGYSPNLPALLSYAVSTPAQEIKRMRLSELAEQVQKDNSDTTGDPSKPCLLMVGRALGQAAGTFDAAQVTIASRIG